MNPIYYEPKKECRFILNFPDFFNLEDWMVLHLTRPSFTNINGVKWENITIFFRDCVAPSTSQRLYDLTLMMKDGELKFPLILKMLDPVGETVEQWTINVERIISIDFGICDYSSESTVLNKMVVEPKSCILNY
jgi:hypothetical protein